MADSSEALASHLINQIRSNLAVLEQLNVVQAPDADLIRSKLPPPNGPFPSLQRQQQQQQQQQQFSQSSQPYTQQYPSMSPIPSQQSSSSPIYQPSPGIQPFEPNFGQMTVAAPASQMSQGSGLHGQESRGRALWDYNGAEADDLRFRAGDTIIIDEEVNEQWYRGRVIPQGEQYPRDHRGLFPSNYIEKFLPSAPFYKQDPQHNQPPPMQNMQPPQPQSMVPYQPPLPPSYNPQYSQAPPMIVEDPKKNKFGKLGNTLSHSAVGGLGWGAGSAIGSGLINKIF